MSDINNDLIRLNFSKLESQIYLTLLEDGELSGYQISKKIGVARSSVYPALEGMLNKGYVLLLPEETQIYKAQNPSTLIHRLKNEFLTSADSAEKQLENLYKERHEEKFSNIKGFANVVAKTKELLTSAKKEVYLNTDFDLHLFDNEWKLLKQNHVRIIVFSFAPLNCDGLDIELYTHKQETCKDEMPSRIMIAVDCSMTLVADTYKDRGNWIGTVTNNALMVSIISEHIHHDIYLLKLKEKYGKDLIDESIKLNSMLEGGIK